MKKINGISLLHGIAILSGIGIVGIFAWCDESINEGGRGITPTLLFVVYVLLLLACNAEIIASDENFKRVFDRTKKVYDIAKNNASVEGINLYNFEHDKKCKTVIFVMFGFLLVTLWLAIHFMLIRSLILALLISIGLSYMIITLVLVAWNLAAIRKLDKTRWWGTSYSLETDQFEVSFSDTTNCIPKLTMIIKYKVRNGKKVWRSQVVRYVCNGIYYKNKKDLLERCNVVFNFIK